MNIREIKMPISDADISSLKAGDIVSLSGVIYTARDAAHKKITQLLQSGKKLDFDFVGQTIYYSGPCPTPIGRASGSSGPTTSSRMDIYTPMLLGLGLKAMIGKGGRSNAVIESIIKNKSIYFAAIGGCGAMYGNAVIKSEVVAFPELLSEAVHKLTVKDFLVIVGIDSRGNSIF